MFLIKQVFEKKNHQGQGLEVRLSFSLKITPGWIPLSSYVCLFIQLFVNQAVSL